MTKTEKARAELDHAIVRRDAWQRKVEALQERYEEIQNAEILGVVRQARLTPEQLAAVIANARAGVLNALPEDTTHPTEAGTTLAEDSDRGEEEYEEDADEE